MNKVICDICGTTYQESAECCPICGCSRDMSMEFADDELILDEVMNDEAPSRGKGGRFSSKKKKEIFDYDEVNPEEDDMGDEEEDDAYPGDDEDLYEEEPRHNTFLVVLLVVLIMVLLVGTGYIFIRYFMPNMMNKETVPETSAVVETTEVPTTELSIPCQSLALSGGAAELKQAGNYFLLNVIVSPEDTTDDLVFRSADESIATVTEDGRITAVAEGETEIFITCGKTQLTCPVTCDFSEVTEPPTEETAVEETEETTVATEAALKDVTLKLKKTDVMLKVGYGFTLELDCDLEPEDVEWSVEHEHILKVENGYVTALKSGTTDVIVKYGDQEVRCIVRCYN